MNPPAPPETSEPAPRVPSPVDLTDESVAGEEDPGAALEDMVDTPPPPAPDKRR